LFALVALMAGRDARAPGGMACARAEYLVI
jgi:hypothetical protein